MAEGLFFSATLCCAGWDEALPEATEWISSTLALASPHCWQLMTDLPSMTVGRAPGPQRDLADTQVRWGPDNGAYVSIFLDSPSRPRGSFLRGGWAGVQRALTRLEPGGSLSVIVAPLDEQGLRPHPLRNDGSLKVRRWQVGAEVQLELTAVVGNGEVFLNRVLPQQKAWVEARSVHTAKAGDPGKIDDLERVWEHHIGRVPTGSLRERTDIVHGFNWLTLVPPHLAGRIREDSLDGLFAVERLASGGVWLQATQDPWDYDVAAAQAVRATLLDILPAPTPEPFSRRPWLLGFRVPGSTLGDPPPPPVMT